MCDRRLTNYSIKNNKNISNLCCIFIPKYISDLIQTILSSFSFTRLLCSFVLICLKEYLSILGNFMIEKLQLNTENNKLPNGIFVVLILILCLLIT